MTSSKVCEGGAGLHPPGGAEGVQKWPFVGVTRGARNPVIVHRQFLPATNDEGTGPTGRSLRHFVAEAPGFGRSEATAPVPATKLNARPSERSHDEGPLIRPGPFVSSDAQRGWAATGVKGHICSTV